MHTTPKLLALATAAAALAGGAATAQAQTATTTITVSAAPALKPGDRSPFDVPGVRAIRRGKPIPSGYALVGKRVVTQGSGAGAALTFTCPAGTRLRSFASTGAGFSAPTDYVGRHHTRIISERPSSDGSLYAICR
jgi:hypothetical protein